VLSNTGNTRKAHNYIIQYPRKTVLWCICCVWL